MKKNKLKLTLFIIIEIWWKWHIHEGWLWGPILALTVDDTVSKEMF